MPASEKHVAKVLAYLNENGESKTLKKFEIKAETLSRYKRRKRFFETKNPKILLLDIETARMIFGGWNTGKQYVGHGQIIKDWFMLGWACKWIFEPDTKSDFVTGKEALLRDDSRICKSLWKLVDQADIIITHNGNSFDIPKINTRFFLNGLPPPMSYQTIDTCRVGRKYFAFSSNALNYLGKLIVNKEKLHTSYQLWIDCENGDQEQLDFMEEYCIGDTTLLEEVYLELRPWIKSHPNLAVLMDAQEQCCPNCGGFDFESNGGYYTTPQNRYESVRCKSCGAVNRKRSSEITKDQRKALLVPSAR